MDYSIIGFPRIGIHRELKFATEAYFRSEIDADELKRVVSQQRMEQWTRQRDAGAGFIPSNDFSLYDGMLDTAYMLNAIPRRYADLRLSDIDTYFAMARGYQGAQGDVKAFTMKKWFNTNYHYMVPELDDDMELKLRSDAFLDGFHQARSLGIQTKPVVAGPFTFLKLARCTGNKSATDFVDDILFAYADILKRCGENGVEWLQVDEPYLVMDLTMGDVALFRKLYQTLLEQKGTVKVLLQTYFGDVRDCYRQLCELPFARKHTEAFYSSAKPLMDDIAQAYIAVLHQLYDAGCRNVQFDDCTWGMLADKNGQEMHAATKEGLLAVQNAYKDINNQVINGAPEGMNITTHVCRGNYHSTYASSGPYDSVADVLFGEENVSAYYLEFDDERSGGFAPLAKIGSGQKVVLGLITTKQPQLENKEAVIARIHEAAKYIPLDRLYLSPQCGFASCEIGNKLTEEEQWAKLALVKEIAEEVWG